MKKSSFSFYLSDYEYDKFTKCPKCRNTTKVRKYCLMIHYEDKAANFHQIISLNKTCKFCPYCELIITHKSEMNSFVEPIITRGGYTFDPDNYFIFGTLDRKLWKKNKEESVGVQEIFDSTMRFKRVLNFKIIRGGWYKS